jgi:hypothetical protein
VLAGRGFRSGRASPRSPACGSRKYPPAGPRHLPFPSSADRRNSCLWFCRGQRAGRVGAVPRGRSMEEDEWLTCTYPSPMLECLPAPTARKQRLYAVPCCRRVWDYLPGAGRRHAVEVAERFADGTATPEELEAACEAVESRPSADYGPIPVVRPAALPNAGAGHCALNTSLLFADVTAPDEGGRRWEEAGGAESSAQAVLRCVFGNPFRPVTFSPSWRADTVCRPHARCTSRGTSAPCRSWPTRSRPQGTQLGARSVGVQHGRDVLRECPRIHLAPLDRRGHTQQHGRGAKPAVAAERRPVATPHTERPILRSAVASSIASRPSVRNTPRVGRWFGA